jgi:hypothetical protein
LPDIRRYSGGGIGPLDASHVDHDSGNCRPHHTLRFVALAGAANAHSDMLAQHARP